MKIGGRRDGTYVTIAWGWVKSGCPAGSGSGSVTSSATALSPPGPSSAARRSSTSRLSAPSVVEGKDIPEETRSPRPTFTNTAPSGSASKLKSAVYKDEGRGREATD